jgi:hypothetical protein
MNMAIVELIDLDGEDFDGSPIYGKYPQYPECPFAFTRKNWEWTQIPKKIPIILCSKGGCIHRGTIHRGLCLEHIKVNKCPYNISDEDALEYLGE